MGWALALTFTILMLQLREVMSVPCPPGAVFSFVPALRAPMCVCGPALRCVGDRCRRPGDAESIGTAAPLNRSSTRGPDFALHDMYVLGEVHKARKSVAATLIHSHTRNRIQTPRFQSSCSSCKCVGEGTKDVPAAMHVRSASGEYQDPLFDEICQVEAGSRPPHPRPVPNIAWLHFPKCGSSFTSLIYNYVCQDYFRNYTMMLGEEGEKPEDFSYYATQTCTYCWKRCSSNSGTCFTEWAPHDGLSRGPNQQFLLKACAAKLSGVIQGHSPALGIENFRSGVYAAMFRDPRRRLYSAFNYMRHAMGMPISQHQTLKNLQTLEEFAHYDGIAGCMTKMLTGRQCATQRGNLTQDILDLAVSRVEGSLAFVGLVDYWNTSVCLFHRMFGHRIHPHEVMNLRATDSEQMESLGYSQAPPDAWRQLKPEDDPFDWVVWRTARNVFVERLIEYGLTIPSALVNEMEDYP